MAIRLGLPPMVVVIPDAGNEAHSLPVIDRLQRHRGSQPASQHHTQTTRLTARLMTPDAGNKAHSLSVSLQHQSLQLAARLLATRLTACQLKVCSGFLLAHSGLHTCTGLHTYIEASLLKTLNHSWHQGLQPADYINWYCVTGPAAHPATPAPIIPTPKGGKGKGGKGKDGKAGKATGTPIVIGSGKHLVRYTDSSGTTHHDQTLNLFCCVGKKKVLISGVRSEFAADAPIACIPCLMSHLFGDLRFTVCDQHLTDPANHGTFTSAAHRFPGDYKRRIRRHFH